MHFCSEPLAASNNARINWPHHQPALAGWTQLITLKGACCLLTMYTCPCVHVVGLLLAQWPLGGRTEKRKRGLVYKYGVNGTFGFTLPREAPRWNELYSLIFSHHLSVRKRRWQESKLTSGWGGDYEVDCSKDRIELIFSFSGGRLIGSAGWGVRIVLNPVLDCNVLL